MGLTSVHGPTQDTTSAAVTVAAVANQDDATKAIQAVAIVGSKTDYAPTARTGIAASDQPTGGDLTTTGFAGTAGANLTAHGNAQSFVVSGSSTMAGTTLTGRLALYDNANNFVCFSGAVGHIILSADATLRLGNGSGNYPSNGQIVDGLGSTKFRFFVDTVSGGTWTVTVHPC